jgi:GT2 family glycosyltransferase
MVSVALDPAVGAVGARLMFENGTIQHVGVIFDNGMSPIHALGSEVDDAGRFGSKVLDLDYPAVTGACLLTPASLFREVGGFCVDLPLNFNDIDYCLKVAASGHAVVTAGFATLFHYESSTRGHATEPEEFTFLDRHWGLRRRLDQHVHYRSVL